MDENTPAPAGNEQPKKQRSSVLRHIMAVLLTLVLIFLAMLVFLFRDELTGEGLRRNFGREQPIAEEYEAFTYETGAEQVGNYFRWVYFRKKTAHGPFDLYSDLDSRIRHLKRIIALILPISLANLCIGFSNVGNAMATGIWIAKVGYLNLIIGALGCMGAWKLIKKRKRLEEEAQIFE